METNRDHSVVFEIASKYCISASFVDHDGYSISSEGFLPIVLTEAEDIKKRWQEYTEERYKKDLHDLDNHDPGMQSQVGLRKHHYEQS